MCRDSDDTDWGVDVDVLSTSLAKVVQAPGEDGAVRSQRDHVALPCRYLDERPTNGGGDESSGTARLTPSRNGGIAHLTELVLATEEHVSGWNGSSSRASNEQHTQ